MYVSNTDYSLPSSLLCTLTHIAAAPISVSFMVAKSTMNFPFNSFHIADGCLALNAFSRIRFISGGYSSQTFPHSYVQ